MITGILLQQVNFTWALFTALQLETLVLIFFSSLSLKIAIAPCLFCPPDHCASLPDFTASEEGIFFESGIYYSNNERLLPCIK